VRWRRAALTSSGRLAAGQDGASTTPWPENSPAAAGKPGLRQNAAPNPNGLRLSRAQKDPKTDGFPAKTLSELVANPWETPAFFSIKATQ